MFLEKKKITLFFRRNQNRLKLLRLIHLAQGVQKRIIQQDTRLRSVSLNKTKKG